MDWAITEKNYSQRRACALAGVNPRVYRRQPKRPEDKELRHARLLIAAWREDYNHHRPHTSLDGLTPCEYHQRSREDPTLNRANQ